eukprot:NODE_33_length_32023_cov_0.217579.p15 type:complete len:207 gc:universal NODE_33_length_32023_cov_0.217579:281-901(+)
MNSYIIKKLEEESILEIVIGSETRVENNALMVTKELILEYKFDSGALGTILYPFQKTSNGYQNYLQLQLYSKNHSIWHQRKLLNLDDFSLVLGLYDRFPNNYYLCDYLFWSYNKKHSLNLLSNEYDMLLATARKWNDHSILWCWYRCSRLHMPSISIRVLEIIDKMAKSQWNFALENVIYAFYSEYKMDNLCMYLGALNERRLILK